MGSLDENYRYAPSLGVLGWCWGRQQGGSVGWSVLSDLTGRSYKSHVKVNSTNLPSILIAKQPRQVALPQET